jgi:alpha-tubulin suppressor-like RCC1 family protein
MVSPHRIATLAAFAALGCHPVERAPEPVLDASTAAATDAPAPELRAKAIACGLTAACAVMRDGTVRCWGRALETPETERRPPALVAGLKEVTQVAVGTIAACARLTGGGVRCWGSNDLGDLGARGRDAGPGPVNVAGLGPVAQVAMGFGLGCAAEETGRAHCWGADDPGGATIPDALREAPGSGDVGEIAVGAMHACARLRDGRIGCWGLSFYGQLGNGAHGPSPTRQRSASPVTGIDDAEAIAAGAMHTCAVRRGGGVWCWGSNEACELGDGTTVHRATPVRVKGEGRATAVALGNERSLALLAGGSVVAWGHGIGAPAESAPSCTPRPVVGLPPANAICAAEDHACALVGDGEVWCWGDGTKEPTRVRF